MIVPRPGRWAGMSVIASALILVIAYWRLHAYGLDLGWSSLALVLAGLNLAAAASVARRAKRRTRNRDRTRCLRGRRVRRDDPRRNLRAVDRLADRRNRPSSARDRLGRGADQPQGAALGRRRARRDRAGAARASIPTRSPIRWRRRFSTGCSTATACRRRPSSSRPDNSAAAPTISLCACSKAGSLLLITMLLTFELRHALYGRIDAPLSDLGKDALDPCCGSLLAGGSCGWARGATGWCYGSAASSSRILASAQIVFWQVLVDSPLFHTQLGRTRR